MYLKRIELYGFKSFADRTELEFVPGVTAVVGPNGSGKSNVSDSIRWVLGEQSAKSLRGAKMEDIIFAGSDTRKAVNYAEVGLTLENADRSLDVDYSEVTVTRRVYRSGDSEFFINKQSCRLKDITELFMDTGLGKEAYSIIGQGRIEEILSTKSEDRRGIFEEAAGVVKYKSRKKDAERKLDETEGNLVRLQDIIFEIEEQLSPLKEQAEKAARYKSIKSELTTKEIATYVYLIESLHHKWEEASSLLIELQQKEQNLGFQVNREDAKLEQTKWNISQIEEQLDSLQQQLLLVTEAVEKLEGQREVIKERTRNFSTNKQEVVEKLQTLSHRKRELDQELEVENGKKLAIQKVVQQSQKNLLEEEKALADMVQNVDERLDRLKGDYIELLNEQASMKNELRHLDQFIDQYTQKIDHLNRDHGRFVDERNQLIQEITRKEEDITQVSAKVLTIREEYQGLLHSKKDQQQGIEKLEETYRHYLNQLEKLKSRKSFLQDMKEEFTGFFQGVKEVLKSRESHLRGIDGAIAELIKVPKEYEIAIETALGASLQHVVTQDEESARKAIAFLKQRKLGRATFLPRNVIKSREISQSDLHTLKQSPSFVGLAHHLISYDEKMSNVIGNLLGHVIVTKELKEANQLAKQLHYRFRFVTLDGDLVNVGGSMTGGSVKQNQSNLLGREREIELLTAEIMKADNAINEKKEEITAKKDLVIQFEKDLEHLSTQGEFQKEQEQRLKEELSQILFSKKRLDEKLEIYDQDYTSFQSELTQSKTKKVTYLKSIQEFHHETSRIEREIKELESMKKEKQITKEEKNQQITQLKVELARNVQECEGLQRNVERLEHSKKQLDYDLSETQQNLLRLEGDLGQQDDQVDELEALIKEKKEEKDQLSITIEEDRQKRKKEQHEQEHLEILIKQYRKEWRTVEDLAHQEEVKANRLDVELDNYLNLLREEYELSFELAKERYPLEQDYDIVKREVDELKRQLAQLGSVHLGAIEEYDRLVERYDFLKRQEEDLQSAKETLYRVISEMDEEMTKRFEATFDQVRVQFLDVFQQLFGGGRADLLLTNPEKLLTTGVDIVAQPPGKKLQHLALLSGGERALTAMALLFAILRVKPVPFCVLDEVEAALDEANVSRFAQYLREFSKQTQFIVITHRKGTMEGADVLYGVTMQESGVSKLVSVKLEDRSRVMPA
jgi:chromosome segregation protein